MRNTTSIASSITSTKGTILLSSIFALLFFYGSAKTAFPQTASATNAPAEALQAMTSRSSLDEIASRPWHLKIDATFFDEKGQTPNSGTIEVWQSGENRRTVLKFGNATQTELLSDGKKYYGSSGGSLPGMSTEVLDAFLHPGPSAFYLQNAKPELRVKKIGSQSFDCIMLSIPFHAMKEAPLGLFPTYCAVQGTADLRIAYATGVDTVLRKQIGRFLDHSVTTELSLSAGSTEIAHAKLSSLTSFLPAANEFDPASDVSLVSSNATLVSGGVIAGNKISGKIPYYPQSAREAHVFGSVILRAVIGVDGHIHSLRVMSAPDPDLAISALMAVRTWQYKPYLLNGEPTSVDTTITVNFDIR